MDRQCKEQGRLNDNWDNKETLNQKEPDEKRRLKELNTHRKQQHEKNEQTS